MGLLPKGPLQLAVAFARESLHGCSRQFFSCCMVGLLEVAFSCNAHSNTHAHQQPASDQASGTCLPFSPYASPRACPKKAENE